jgi:N utilization substance protein A
LSRTHPEFLVSLFKTEVPEISEGIVSIKGAARDPGSRAKIAVSSTDSDIDPVGACVGIKGSRVQNVVKELRGEKIDIIPWHLDAAKFVCNALAPAKISRVIIDEDSRTMEVIVPDDFLPMAIGKKGQNVKLASKLTGWHLDVKSESRYSVAMKHGYESLTALPGVGISLADKLYENGFYSAEEVSKAGAEDIAQAVGLELEEALNLIRFATAHIESIAKIEDDEQPEDDQQIVENHVGVEGENDDLESAQEIDGSDDDMGNDTSLDMNSLKEETDPS